MPKLDSATINSVINRWTVLRKTWVARSGAPAQGDIARFIKETNYLSQQLINALDINDPDMLVALSECAGNAAAMLTMKETQVNGG